MLMVKGWGMRSCKYIRQRKATPPQKFEKNVHKIEVEISCAYVKISIPV
jgi:hypothetical protein